MDGPTPITLLDVMNSARLLAAALRAVDAVAASRLEASAAAGGSDAERLLELRSALVATRDEWEHLEDAELVASARRVLASAKRLAIDL